MTAPDHSAALARLAVIAAGTGQVAEDVRGLLARVEALNERLENNRVYGMNGERKDVEPGSIPDGIECRDETIKLARENCERLRARLEAAEARVVELTTNARTMMGSLRDALSKQARASVLLGGRHPLSPPPPPTEASGSATDA